jgi:hypothetical protein
MALMRILLLLGCVAVVGVAPVAGSPSPPLASILDTLPGEAMYPLPSQDVWVLVQEMARDLRFRTEKNDRQHQVLVTQWRNYDTRVLPHASALGLRDGDRPLRVQFHVMVARDRQPARVAVGSILEIERALAGRRTTVIGYRLPVLDNWFLTTLGDRAGVRHQPMPSSWQARSELAAAVMPTGLADPCLARPERDPRAPTSPPRKISDVRPIFPSQGFESGAGKVLVGGWLTEHGTLTGLTIVNPSEKVAHYESSARAAASLWRLEPVSIDGCPVVSVFTLTVNYTIR